MGCFGLDLLGDERLESQIPIVEITGGLIDAELQRLPPFHQTTALLQLVTQLQFGSRQSVDILLQLGDFILLLIVELLRAFNLLLGRPAGRFGVFHLQLDVFHFQIALSG